MQLSQQVGKISLVALAALCSCSTRGHRAAVSGPGLVGKWSIVEKGVDTKGAACPFIPDTMEFFTDGTVAVSTLPSGKMLYKAVTDSAEMQRVAAKYPHAKPGRTLLMMLDSQTDWLSAGMAYGYEVAGDALVLEFPGWSSSRFARQP